MALRPRSLTQMTLARAGRALASITRAGERGWGGNRTGCSIRESSTSLALDEDPASVGGGASKDGNAGGNRYAEGPCTRMNLFTAVNAGLRTALETDDSAVSFLDYLSSIMANSLFVVKSLVSAGGQRSRPLIRVKPED